MIKLKPLTESWFGGSKKGPESVVSRASNGDFKVSPKKDYYEGNTYKFFK